MPDKYNPREYPSLPTMPGIPSDVARELRRESGEDGGLGGGNDEVVRLLREISDGIRDLTSAMANGGGVG